MEGWKISVKPSNQFEVAYHPPGGLKAQVATLLTQWQRRLRNGF